MSTLAWLPHSQWCTRPPFVHHCPLQLTALARLLCGLNHGSWLLSTCLRPHLACKLTVCLLLISLPCPGLPKGDVGTCELPMKIRNMTMNVTWLQFWGMYDFHPHWTQIFHNRVSCMVPGRVSAGAAEVGEVGQRGTKQRRTARRQRGCGLDLHKEVPSLLSRVLCIGLSTSDSTRLHAVPTVRA